MTTEINSFWQIACRSKDLKRAPISRVINGQPIVLFRDSRGQVIALEDRCAHRNAPLSLGRIQNGRLQCAYHGWEYDSEGKVVHVPALPVESKPCTGLCVRSFLVREQDEFVWLTLESKAPSQEPPAFPYFNQRGWTSFVIMTRFRGTVEACLENFLDCPHATYVHRYWFRAPTAKPVKVVVRTLPDGAIAEYFGEPRKKSAVWWLLAPRRGEMIHTDRYIAPSMSRVDYQFPNGLHYIISSSCTEVSAGEIEVYTVISFKFGWLAPLVRLYFEPLSRLIIRQDVDILAAQQKNIARFGTPCFASTKADLLGPHIAAWRQALKAGQPPPTAFEERRVNIRL
jgi:phenylpropionate dioxygenase-like ring-hydroxylating dioxygenase large terminal subunit